MSKPLLQLSCWTHVRGLEVRDLDRVDLPASTETHHLVRTRSHGYLFDTVCCMTRCVCHSQHR